MGFNLKSLLPYAAGAVTSGVMNRFAPTANYSALGGAVAGALTNKKSPLTGAAQGFVGGGVGSALGGMLPGGTGAMEGLKTYGNSIPGFGGVGTNNPTGVFAKWLSPGAQAGTKSMFSTAPAAAGNANTTRAPWGSSGDFRIAVDGQAGPWKPTSMLSPAALNTTAAAGDVASNVSNAPMVKKGLFDKFWEGAKSGTGQTLAGFALPLIGNALTPDVEAPNFQPAMAPLWDKYKNPSADLQLATQTMRNTVNAPLGQDATAANAIAQRNSDLQTQENLKEGRLAFAAANPGNDITNNSALQDYNAKILGYQNLNDQARNAQTQFLYDQQQKANQMAAANTLAELDSAQTQFLASLTQADLYSIMEQNQYDQTQRDQLMNLWAKAGEMMATKGLGLDQVKGA